MTLSLSNHLAADAAYEALCRDVSDGLRKTPKSLPPRWFYDAVGSDLFAQITRLQLDALRDAGSLRRYVPFGVGAGMLSAAATAIAREYPTIEIDAVCCDFEEHLAEIPDGGRRLFVFVGSTIGNLTPGPRAEFLATLAEVLAPGDSLLPGTDLVKDVDRLVRAYDDATGVTARFNRNVIAVINRELDADFDLGAYEHVARWNAHAEQTEMWLRASRPQRVRVGVLDLTVEFGAGEEMLTEVSCKFRPHAVADRWLAARGRRRRSGRHRQRNPRAQPSRFPFGNSCGTDTNPSWRLCRQAAHRVPVRPGRTVGVVVLFCVRTDERSAVRRPTGLSDAGEVLGELCRASGWS